MFFYWLKTYSHRKMKKQFSYNLDWKCGQCRPKIKLHICTVWSWSTLSTKASLSHHQWGKSKKSCLQRKCFQFDGGLIAWLSDKSETCHLEAPTVNLAGSTQSFIKVSLNKTCQSPGTVLVKSRNNISRFPGFHQHRSKALTCARAVTVI